MATAYVVTSTGHVMQYAGVGYVLRGELRTELYADKEKTSWIADVPKGWAVGWSQPRKCGIDTVAEDLRRDIRNAPGSVLASIKRALQKFDSRTHTWRT
jgi:hypothetical protein